MIVGPAIQLLLDGHHLSREDAHELMGSIMDGEATPGPDRRASSSRCARRARPPTRSRASPRRCASTSSPSRRSAPRSSTSSARAATAPARSTSRPTAALVAAAAGAAVAKHGNRAASSAAGSADVLEALGIGLEQTPERIALSIDDLGFGFMFARAHHPAMRFVAPVREEIGIRTVFNVLGPLANPAGARDGVFGVYSAELAPSTPRRSPSSAPGSAFVVHGHGGLDELSPFGPNLVVEVVRRRRARVGARPARPRHRARRSRTPCAAARRPRTRRSSAPCSAASRAAGATPCC